MNKPGGIISDSPVAEKLLMTDLDCCWPPPKDLLLKEFFDSFSVPVEGGSVGHRLAVTGKLRNSSFFPLDVGSSDSFSDKLLSCLKSK